jgi:glycosyltransferase involved in cell wall biosynthesis
MRIGIDITPLAKPRTGVGHYCYCLLKNILPLAPEDFFQGLATGLTPIEDDDLPGAIPYRRLPIPTRVMHRIWNFAHAPKADSLLGGLDVYHATNYFLPPMRSARRILTIHDLCFLVKPELCSPKIAHYFAKHVPKFIEQSDAVLACSHSTKNDILRFSSVDPLKIHVVHEAADEDFSPMRRDLAQEVLSCVYGLSGPFLLFVSTIEPRKNLSVLLRAFSRISREIPHKLILIGTMGWNAEPPEKMIADLGLKERVIHMGFLSRHADLAAFYSAADAFIFPTLYEGFGLTLIEAMTCGCPVVTSDNSSVPEVVGDAALQVNAQDIEAIASAILRLLDDDSLRDELIAKGFNQARSFSWNRCAAETLEAYRSLC